MCRWEFFYTLAENLNVMIEPLPIHEDEWAYYESEPLFDYVCQVSDETVLDINPDGRVASTTPHLQSYRFACDYHDGKINTKDIKMNLYESPEIQNTLKAFGLDSSKFWYLCLYIKWRVYYISKTAFNFLIPTKDKLDSLITEFEKISPEIKGDRFITKVPAKLTFKVEGSKTITIEDGHTLTIICAAIEHLMEQYDVDLLSPKHCGFNDTVKFKLSTRNEMYLFYQYLDLFIRPLHAKGSRSVSKDKSLLISRMLYIFDICRNPELMTDMVSGGKRKNILKGYLSKYKHPKFRHF